METLCVYQKHIELYYCVLSVVIEEFLEKLQKLEVVSSNSLNMHVIVNGTFVDNDFLT